MGNITTIGLDLAKNVFQVHGIGKRCPAPTYLWLIDAGSLWPLIRGRALQL